MSYPYKHANLGLCMAPCQHMKLSYIPRDPCHASQPGTPQNDLRPSSLPAATCLGSPDDNSGTCSVRCQSSLSEQKLLKSWNSIHMSLDKRIGSLAEACSGSGVNRRGVPKRALLRSSTTKCRHRRPVGTALRPPPLAGLAGRM